MRFREIREDRNERQLPFEPVVTPMDINISEEVARDIEELLNKIKNGS